MTRLACAALALVLLAVSPVTAPPFREVTREAGITFRHHNGASGKKYLPETMGSGLAFLDLEGDGDQDVFFVNGAGWPGQKGGPHLPALYRNRGDGTFEDATREAGLAVEAYGLGAAAADVDNDGDADLFVTALGRDRLLLNDGRGRFRDATAAAGLEDGGFGSSAAFVDYDRDGDADLYVCNYVRWTAETDIRCTLDGVHKSYCTPQPYPGAANRLYRNEGGTRFKDVTRDAGLLDETGKALGVAVLDYDRDGWPDLAVAHDTQPNRLYRNKGNGSFEERGLAGGIAFDENGRARGAMGIDAADYDGSGFPSLVIGNFSNEMVSLYHNEGKGFFVDASPASGVGSASLLTLAFGAFFFDYDLDGWPDIFLANGHVENDIQKVQANVAYAQPAHLFRNLGGGRFEDAAPQAPDLARPRVARGAAYADVDGDGDLDVAVSTAGGAAALFRNEAPATTRRLRVTLVGSRSNRSALGAEAHLTTGGRRRWQMVRSGSSYCSQSELPLTFGLGAEAAAGPLDVYWPSGAKDSVPRVEAGQHLVIEEGKGVVRQQALRAPR
jgi:enediyne biosynthesis protein E4